MERITETRYDRKGSRGLGFKTPRVRSQTLGKWTHFECQSSVFVQVSLLAGSRVVEEFSGRLHILYSAPWNLQQQYRDFPYPYVSKSKNPQMWARRAPRYVPSGNAIVIDSKSLERPWIDFINAPFSASSPLQRFWNPQKWNPLPTLTQTNR